MIEILHHRNSVLPHSVLFGLVLPTSLATVRNPLPIFCPRYLAPKRCVCAVVSSASAQIEATAGNHLRTFYEGSVDMHGLSHCT